MRAQLARLQAITDGVLKVMSKMGISTIASYKGSQVRGSAHALAWRRAALTTREPHRRFSRRWAWALTS